MWYAALPTVSVVTSVLIAAICTVWPTNFLPITTLLASRQLILVPLVVVLVKYIAIILKDGWGALNDAKACPKRPLMLH